MEFLDLNMPTIVFSFKTTPRFLDIGNRQSFVVCTPRSFCFALAPESITWTFPYILIPVFLAMDHMVAQFCSCSHSCEDHAWSLTSALFILPTRTAHGYSLPVSFLWGPHGQLLILWHPMPPNPHYYRLNSRNCINSPWPLFKGQMYSFNTINTIGT
jgi:hypothetical protein